MADALLVLGAAGMMKLDAGGNVRWAKTYSGPEEVNLASLDVHPDGQLVACGMSGTSPPQAFAMGLDANGEVLWSRGYGGSDCTRVRTTRDGGSVLVGRIGSNNGDLYAVKLGARGRRELETRRRQCARPHRGHVPQSARVQH